MGNTCPIRPNPGKLGVLRDVATEAALAAGQLLKQHLRSPKKINDVAAHDLKLELDVRCQLLISGRLQRADPAIALLGEEGTLGDPQADWRWVVDPIDGTVNYAYQIPHACVSIALQRRVRHGPGAEGPATYQTCAGVVHDPFCAETWTAIRGQRARLNDIPIRVSPRTRLAEAVISIGFAKQDANLQALLPSLNRLVPRVRKVRIMGSAALDLVYVASGRMDAYVEAGVRLWDIAAGGLILESAGGDFAHLPLPGDHYYYVMATNGGIKRSLRRFCPSVRPGARLA